jgi:Patatin-like phospholipase
VAVTAFDLQTFQGKVLTTGSMARAARASATFPLLFQPVGWLDSDSSISSSSTNIDDQNDYIFIDGGIADPNGLVGLTKTLPSSSCRRVVNLSIGPFVPVRPPFDTATTELISISIEGLPQPGPLAMDKGPKSFAAAREAMRKALDTTLVRRGDVFELTIVHAAAR